MARCFANINGITSRTNKFIYHTRTERPGHTILNRNQAFNFKRRKCQFDIKIFTILFSEHAYLTLGKIRDVKKWQFKINSGSIIILNCHFLTSLILPSVRYACSLKSIVKILISNWHFLLLKLKT